jgi:hypothetical protein
MELRNDATHTKKATVMLLAGVHVGEQRVKNAKIGQVWSTVFAFIKQVYVAATL